MSTIDILTSIIKYILMALGVIFLILIIVLWKFTSKLGVFKAAINGTNGTKEAK